MATDFERIFAALDGTNARFVVTGGVAVVLHGHARFTADLDLSIALDPANVNRVLDALGSLGYAPSAPVDARGLADPEQRRAWQEEHHALVLSFTSPQLPATAVDVFIAPPLPFDELHARALPVAIGRETVRVASLDDLIAMKKLAGRPRDLEDIRELEALR